MRDDAPVTTDSGGASFAPLQTARLDLRRLELADIDTVHRIAGDVRVARFLARMPYPLARSAVHRWIEGSHKEMAAGAGFTFACWRRADGTFLGCASLTIASGDLSGELGYWLDPAHWGHGYASEAVSYLVGLAFRSFGLRRVWAAAHCDNAASHRVLETAGMTTIGSGRLAFQASGETAAVRIYQLTRDAAVASRPPHRSVVFVSALAMIDGEDRVLVAERPAGKAMAGLWEFPGGKVHVGETARRALVREIREELAVELTVDSLIPLTIASHRYDHFHLLMPLFVCRIWGGMPAPREGQKLSWVSIDKLSSLSMPAADAPLVATLGTALCG